MSIKKTEKQELLEKLNLLIKKQSFFQQEINNLKSQIIRLKVMEPDKVVSEESESEKIKPAELEAPKEKKVHKLLEETEIQQKRTWKKKNPFGTEIEKFIGENLINKIGIAVLIIGVGIGVNHFSTIYKEQTEYKELVNKAEHTIRILNDRINSILRKTPLTNEDKDTIDALLNLMDYWGEYYDKVDASKIAYHKKLKRDLEQANEEDKSKLQNELDTLEYNLLQNGLTSYIGLSGSTAYNYFKTKEE